jgi:hypothetical protein
MVSEWRQGLGKPHLPYFQQRERPYDRMAERLRAQQKLIQTLLDDAIVLKTDGPEHHKGHFDGLGMRRWGIEAADAFIEHDWLSLVLDDRFY